MSRVFNSVTVKLRNPTSHWLKSLKMGTMKSSLSWSLDKGEILTVDCMLNVCDKGSFYVKDSLSWQKLYNSTPRNTKGGITKDVDRISPKKSGLVDTYFREYSFQIWAKWYVHLSNLKWAGTYCNLRRTFKSCI